VFSTVDWDYLWHRPQVVMSRLARDDWQVLYVDTLGLRTPRPRDLPRILSRVRHRLAAQTSGLLEPVPGLRVLSPLLLPLLNSPLARRINVRRLVPQFARHLKALGSGDPVVWVYLPTMTVLDCIRALPHRLLVYEAIDALASNPAGASLDFDVAEQQILRQADLVITSSESLQRDKAPHNANTHWVPSGVAEAFFTPQAVPSEITTLPAPRIGFFGTFDHRLDLALMCQLAAEHPGWIFVLIGPARIDLARLTAHPNVHWLGTKPHAELPGLLAGLSAVYLPYILDDFTAHIYPAKIHECLALGLPVVATSLPALEPFEGLIRLVRPGQRFGEGLRLALAEDDPDLRQRRVVMARENSWDVRYGEICRLLERALAARGQE
jgi:glycosyltransferase involved in cell wall biosynthesis